MRKQRSFYECDERSDPYRTKYVRGLEDESIAGTKQTIPPNAPKSTCAVNSSSNPARFDTGEKKLQVIKTSKRKGLEELQEISSKITTCTKRKHLLDEA